MFYFLNYLSVQMINRHVKQTRLLLFKVRCEASMTEFFYNDTQPAFGETRIIIERLQLNFVGSPPFVFKPGMSFEGRVSIIFKDQV